MSDSKVCSRCKQSLPLAAFAKLRRNKDGLLNHCRNCEAIANAARKPQLAANAKKYKQRNKDKLLQYDKQYYEANKVAITERKRRYNHSHETKLKARIAVRDAVRRQRLAPVSKMGCKDCGAPASEYHHTSYAKSDWLKVIPLCHSCHLIRHRRLHAEPA